MSDNRGSMLNTVRSMYMADSLDNPYGMTHFIFTIPRTEPRTQERDAYRRWDRPTRSMDDPVMNHDLRDRIIHKYNKKMSKLRKKGHLKAPTINSTTAIPNCSICLEEFTCGSTIDGAVVMMTDCRHIFHFSCIWTWLQNKHSCPLCRNKLDLHSCTSVMKSLHILPYCQALVDWLQERPEELPMKNKIGKRKSIKLALNNFVGGLSVLMSRNVITWSDLEVAEDAATRHSAEAYFSHIYCL